VANHRVCTNVLPLGASIHGTLTTGGFHYVMVDVWLVLVEYEEWGIGNGVCGGIQLWFVAGFTFGLPASRAFVPLLWQHQSECSEMGTITGELPFIVKTYGQLFGTEI